MLDLLLLANQLQKLVYICKEKLTHFNAQITASAVQFLSDWQLCKHCHIDAL